MITKEQRIKIDECRNDLYKKGVKAEVIETSLIMMEVLFESHNRGEPFLEERELEKRMDSFITERAIARLIDKGKIYVAGSKDGELIYDVTKNQN
jgi:hypothetical protein